MTPTEFGELVLPKVRALWPAYFRRWSGDDQRIAHRMLSWSTADAVVAALEECRAEEPDDARPQWKRVREIVRKRRSPQAVVMDGGEREAIETCEREGHDWCLRPDGTPAKHWVHFRQTASDHECAYCRRCRKYGVIEEPVGSQQTGDGV
ncbi:MAG: hypothetical protein AABZ12_00300 [Planctomycetota bacterium]